jgi:hypothetical protein
MKVSLFSTQKISFLKNLPIYLNKKIGKESFQPKISDRKTAADKTFSLV